MITQKALKLATLIHRLDEAIFDKRRAPVIIREEHCEDDLLRKGGDKNPALCIYEYNRGHDGFIYDEHYFIYQSALEVFSNTDFDKIVWPLAAHEVRHRVQINCRNSISFSLWKKIRRLVWCGTKFGRWETTLVLFVGAFKNHLKHKNKLERDAYFVTYLTHAFGNKCDLELAAKAVMF